MKNLLMSIVLVLACISVCSAETAKDAVRALMKLEARCEAGISYKDFSPAIGDTKFDVNVYNASEDSKKYPELTLAINKAMSHYMAANSIWSVKFSVTPHDGFVPKRLEGVDQFLQQYPEIDKDIDQGGVLDRVFLQKAIHIDSAVKHALEQASKEIKTAFTLLPK